MDFAELQQAIEGLRDVGEDYLIVSVGVRGPNIDCGNGNAIATVRMGNDEATSEALHLEDAVALARGKILRKRKAQQERQANLRKKSDASTSEGVELETMGEPK